MTQPGSQPPQRWRIPHWYYVLCGIVLAIVVVVVHYLADKLISGLIYAPLAGLGVYFGFMLLFFDIGRWWNMVSRKTNKNNK